MTKKKEEEGDHNKYQQFIENNFQNSSEDLLKLEILTRGQRDNKEWIKQRKIRITASNFGTIFKARSTKRMISITNAVLNPKNISNIPAIHHGITLEKAALESYECLTGIKCLES